MQKVNQNAALTVMNEAERTTFKFIDFLQNATFCREFFYNMDVINELATIAYYSRVAREGMDVEMLAKALNVDIDKGEFDRILQRIKTRNSNEETKFLDNLSQSLQNWINRD